MRVNALSATLKSSGELLRIDFLRTGTQHACFFCMNASVFSGVIAAHEAVNLFCSVGEDERFARAVPTPHVGPRPTDPRTRNVQFASQLPWPVAKMQQISAGL